MSCVGLRQAEIIEGHLGLNSHGALKSFNGFLALTVLKVRFSKPVPKVGALGVRPHFRLEESQLCAPVTVPNKGSYKIKRCDHHKEGHRDILHQSPGNHPLCDRNSPGFCGIKPKGEPIGEEQAEGPRSGVEVSFGKERFYRNDVRSGQNTDIEPADAEKNQAVVFIGPDRGRYDQSQKQDGADDLGVQDGLLQNRLLVKVPDIYGKYPF